MATQFSIAYVHQFDNALIGIVVEWFSLLQASIPWTQNLDHVKFPLSACRVSQMSLLRLSVSLEYYKEKTGSVFRNQIPQARYHLFTSGVALT